MLAFAVHDVVHPERLRRLARLTAASALLALCGLTSAGAAQAADLQATPSTFGSVFGGAKAGDVVHLAAGDYGTFNGGSKSGAVTITGAGAGAKMYANLGASQNLVLDGLTLNGLVTSGARNLTVRNSTFTAATTIQTPANVANANVVLDHNTFSGINVCSSCYEGRLAVRGYENTQPVGVTISNNLFGPGGDSDGIQVIGDAYGVQIGPGNEFRGLKQVSTAHTDPIQLYGSSHTLITGNYLHDNETGIMAPDGSDHETITNNVIQTTGYPWPIVMGAGNTNTVTHNTLPGSGGAVEVDHSNGGAVSVGNVVKDNVLAGVVNSTGGKPQGTTGDYNLISGATLGGHDIKGKPTYAGGSAPSTWAGFALAAGSTGTGKASDGNAMGIVPGLTGSPSAGAPGAPSAPGTSTGVAAGTAAGGGTTGSGSTTTAPAARGAGSIDSASAPALAVKKSKSHLRFTSKLRFAVLVKTTAGTTVDRVAFMIDGRWVRTDKTDPFSLTWKVPRNTRYGTHVLTMKAIAKDGGSGTIAVKVRRVRAG
jgi:hypothetical protein